MTNSLNKLLRLNLDASKGYDFAAENIENENFKHFLKAYSRKRKKYAEEIEQIIEELDGDAEKSTTLKGDIHRAFMDLRESVSSSTDAAILDECARGESEALEQYKSFLKYDQVKDDHRRILMTHMDKIRAAKHTMEELERVV